MKDFDRSGNKLVPNEDLVPFGPFCDILQHFEAPNPVKISFFRLDSAGTMGRSKRELTT